MKSTLLAFFSAVLIVIPSFAAKKAPIRVLLIDGQNNHNWKATTPVMVKALEKGGRSRYRFRQLLPKNPSPKIGRNGRPPSRISTLP